MDINKTGEFLAALRKSQGYTQQEVADQLNISNKTISKWEQGKGYPDLTMLPVLAEFYQVSVDEILAGEKMSQQKELDCRQKTELRRHLSGRIHLQFNLCVVAVFVSVLLASLFPYKVWCTIFNILAGGILIAGILMTHYTLSSVGEILEKTECEKLFRAVGQKIFLAIGLIMWSALLTPFLTCEQSYAAALRSHAWVIMCTAMMAVLWFLAQKYWGTFFDHVSSILCVTGLVILNVTAPVFGYLWKSIWYYLGVIGHSDDRILAHRIVLLIHFAGVALIAIGVVRQLVYDRRK